MECNPIIDQINFKSPQEHVGTPTSCVHVGKRRKVKELNFFAVADDDKNCSRVGASSSSSVHHVEKEEIELKTELNLLPDKIHVEHSLAEEEDSIHKKDGRLKLNEMECHLNTQLARMKEENLYLKSMIDQANQNYHTLKMQVFMLLHKHQDHNNAVLTKERQKQEMKPAGIGSSQLIGQEAARKLIASQCSSPRETQSNSNNNIVALESMKLKATGEDMDPFRIGGGGEHGQCSNQAFVKSNKEPKFNHLESGADGSHNSNQASESISNVRKPRVSVRARSEASVISDGCHWRKYGQKMAKGNPCPRSYYRCTMSTDCPVRKQIQRSAEDRTILITTYEGYHNHPLPQAAMAMVTTTAAAAATCTSGSTTSLDPGWSSINPNLSASSFLHYPPSLSATLSSSAPFPTVTLDLTQNQNKPNSDIIPLHDPMFHTVNNPIQDQILSHGQVAEVVRSAVGQMIPQGQSLDEVMNSILVAMARNPSIGVTLRGAVIAAIENQASSNGNVNFTRDNNNDEDDDKTRV